MNDETWKSVPGYEGYYEASTQGGVRSLPRVVRRKNGSVQPWPGKVLTPQRDNSGYLSVTLSRAGSERRVMVHRIVAETFIPNPQKLPMVLHGDGSKDNNTVSNLRWGTNLDNIEDAKRHGTYRRPWADRTHCSRNHEYTVANTRWYKNHRYCRECQRDNQKRYRERGNK
ncbi:HNH endonuclease [Microbacterium phage Cassita]|nr:HNH endonuclease [Microbacterium phage Cassita]